MTTAETNDSMLTSASPRFGARGRVAFCGGGRLLSEFPNIGEGAWAFVQYRTYTSKRCGRVVRSFCYCGSLRSTKSPSLFIMSPYMLRLLRERWRVSCVVVTPQWA